MRCSKYGFEITVEFRQSYCAICGEGCGSGDIDGVTRPRRPLEDIDPFKLAKAMARKREDDRRREIPRLSNCSNCGQHSLYYDMYSDTFECLNPNCQKGRG